MLAWRALLRTLAFTRCFAIDQSPSRVSTLDDVNHHVDRAREFYANSALLGTRTTAPYSFNVTNLVAGTYTLSAKAIDGQGLETTSAPRSIVVSDTNNPPTVSITAPTANANFPAPASQITINATANAGEVNGWITRVEFYVNGTLTNTDTAGPFSFNWTNVPQGSYTLMAKAVDQLNGETMSAPVNVTVGSTAATLYFIHTDQLNSPRVITNGTGQAVWTWLNDDPFGYNAPNENPSGQGTFTCNLRFAGQYFDRETNLHYNYLRDYDPWIGRYSESDPIGLIGGVNTYAYVAGDPVTSSDRLGLMGFGGSGRAGGSYTPFTGGRMDPVPSGLPGDPVGDSMVIAGGSVAVAGAILGATYGIGHAAGLTGILIIAESTFAGAMAGGAIGLAIGAVAGTGIVIVDSLRNKPRANSVRLKLDPNLNVRCP
jgi:RHS repeat-associated protein